MPLPLTTRYSAQGCYLPGKQALLKCFELTSTREAAEYLTLKFEEKLKKTKKLSQFSSILSAVKAHAKLLSFMHETVDNPWDGQFKKKTSFEKLQQSVGQNAFSEIIQKLKGTIRMDFALGEQGEIIRAYSQNGKPLDAAMIDALDRLMNANFANAAKRMVSQGGVVYECDASGLVKKDTKGNPVLAKSEEVRQVLLKVLPQRFLGKNVSFTAVSHPYPAKARTEKAKAPVAAPSREEKEEVTTSTAVQEEKTPSKTTMTGGNQ